MFGNFEFKKEELEEEVSPEKREAFFEDFDKRESVIQKEVEGFLMKLVPEKFKKEAVGLLAAFSIFTASSSAFAEGFKGEEMDKEKLLPPEQSDTIKSEDKNKIAPFDWKKVADKIEISVGGKFEKTPDSSPEAIGSAFYNKIIASNFYKKFSWREYGDAVEAELGPVVHSKNSHEFFAKLSSEKEKLNDKQKALILQLLGNYLHKTYNEDMDKAGKYVEVSNDAMFTSLKDLIEREKVGQSGICGNIHTFLTKTAESLGLEAWLQSGSGKDSSHVWSGMILDSNGRKQVTFLDYETLLPTGTLNYQDALGVAERYHRSVSTFNSFVGNEKEVLFPVKSRAQEVAEKAAGVEETAERLEGELSSGELKKERGLEINLSPEIKEIKLNKDSFGLAYFNFQDFSNNPYQSLEDLNALRGRLNLKGERFGLEADATVLHMNIKDLYGGSVVKDEVITRLAADYIDSHKFTKSELGQFIVNWGVTLQAGLRLPLDKKIETTTAPAMNEAGTGIRLIYVNPAETDKFYIGVQEMFREQTNDFQNQDKIIKEVAKSLTVGAEIKVNEAQVINLEATGSELDWGKKMEVKGGIAGKEWKGELGYEKAISEYERFVPSSEKVSAEVGYKGGPKWEVDVIGSKTTEKYKDADGKDIYNAEVKLKIFLW